MIVKVGKKIEFPSYTSGWLSTRIAGPLNGRILLEVRGHSGMSSWPCGLLTVPEEAVRIGRRNGTTSEYEVVLNPSIYNIAKGEDKKGNALWRFYNAEGQTNLVLFSVSGSIVPEASDSNIVIVLEAEGYSRTGKHGERWSLLVAPVGAVVAIEPYYSIGDPIYYRVTDDGIIELGGTDAVLPPSEW